MLIRYWLVFAVLVMQAGAALASINTPQTQLLAYGPGGPRNALQECADLYKERHGLTVGVVKASPFELPRRIKEDGDLFFTGAEYMLDEFEQKNPGVLDLPTTEKLYPRRIGILVRKGNPLKIKGVSSLHEDGVKLMTANLENMEPFIPAYDNNQYNTQSNKPANNPDNIRRLVYTGLEGANTWRSSEEIDAWVTYESWHVWLKGESEFIKLPSDNALRYTMVALTQRTPKRQLAMKFIDFLKSDDAQKIFEEHGWETINPRQQ